MTPPLSLDQLDASTRRQVLAGEVVVETATVAGKSGPRLVVHASIDAPPGAVWKLIDQADQYASFMPRVKMAHEESREQSPDGAVVRTRMTIDMPFPFKNLSALTEARHTIVEGERYVRAWELVEGDYEENTGSWTLVPLGEDPNRTLVRYAILVIPKVPIPKNLQGLVQGRAMPKLINAMRKRV